MAEDHIISNKVVIWTTTLIIPVVGIILSVYEIFYRNGDDNKGRRPLTVSEKAEKLYNEGQKLESDDKFLLAYQKYQEVQQRYGDHEKTRSTVSAAKSGIDQLRNSLRKQLQSMAKEGTINQLQQQKKAAVVLLSKDQVLWIDEQIAAKRKAEREEQGRLADQLKKAQRFYRRKDFTKAIRIYEKLLDQMQSPDLKRTVKQKCAQSYLLYAGDLYNKSKLTNTLKNFSLTIRERLDKCLQLDEQGHYRKQAQAMLDELK